MNVCEKHYHGTMTKWYDYYVDMKHVELPIPKVNTPTR